MNYNEFVSLYKEQLYSLVSRLKIFPWEVKAAYVNWLANTHYYAKETPRMLSMVASVMPEKNRNICYRFLRHACEEMGHEKQIERDLKYFKYKIEDIPIQNEMKICHRSLSYWGQRSCDAVGFIGWVIMMEGLAVEVGEYIYSEVINNYDVKAGHFLRSHSDEDPDHIDKAMLMLKQLTSDELVIVSEAVEMYTQQYEAFLTAIESKVAKQILAA